MEEKDRRGKVVLKKEKGMKTQEAVTRPRVEKSVGNGGSGTLQKKTQ